MVIIFSIVSASKAKWKEAVHDHAAVRRYKQKLHLSATYWLLGALDNPFVCTNIKKSGDARFNGEPRLLMSSR